METPRGKPIATVWGHWFGPICGERRGKLAKPEAL